MIKNQVLRSNLIPTSILSETDRTGAVLKRVVGSWATRPISAAATLQMTTAMYVQRLEAYTAAVTPELEQDEYPYTWMDSFTQEVSGDAESNQWTNRPIDVKVNRKFRSQQDTLVFLFESTSPDAGNQEVLFVLRVLLWFP